MLADHRDGLGRRDVEARAPVFLTGDSIEVLFNDLLSPTQFVATAHGEIMADRMSDRTIAMGQRGGCRKFGTLAKISARHEVGRMGSVRPEDRRSKEMTNPFYCGMNRAFYWHHKKSKG
jgi:hypothetical protein